MTKKTESTSGKIGAFFIRSRTNVFSIHFNTFLRRNEVYETAIKSQAHLALNPIFSIFVNLYGFILDIWQLLQKRLKK